MDSDCTEECESVQQTIELSADDLGEIIEFDGEEVTIDLQTTSTTDDILDAENGIEIKEQSNSPSICSIRSINSSNDSNLHENELNSMDAHDQIAINSEPMELEIENNTLAEILESNKKEQLLVRQHLQPSVVLSNSINLIGQSAAQNKLFYVKVVPMSQTTTITTTSPSSSSTVTALDMEPTIIAPEIAIRKEPSKNHEERSKNKLPSDTSHSKKSLLNDDVKSTVTNSLETIEHTVNLLNNNKILIKSVKSSNSNGSRGSPICSKDEQIKREKNENDYTKLKSSEPIVPCANFETQIKLNESDVKQECDAKATNKSVFYEKVNDTVDSVTATSTPKIKREFEQLQKTVNESKILTEFIIDQSTRGRRSLKLSKQKKAQQQLLDTQVDMEAHKRSKSIGCNERSRSVSGNRSPLARVRSNSKESDKSGTGSLNSSAGGSGGGNSSKRSTRSQNLDFSAKQKRFLKGIQQLIRGTDDESENSFIEDDGDDLDYYVDNASIPNKQSDGDALQQCNQNVVEKKKMVAGEKKTVDGSSKVGADSFCWRCHQTDCQIACNTCIRSYHLSCVKLKQTALHELEKWQCPECADLTAAENDEKKKFDPQQLNKLLKFVMDRILVDTNSKQFKFPFDRTTYLKSIVNPVDLSSIEESINLKRYKTTESFLSDIKWILHNCTICFSQNYKLMSAAKSLLKVCKQEMFDIETCAECYLNANTMTDNWFIEVCSKPHLILWAKLKGFPYWPAKAMTINAQLVDVRFFGDHDRAFVPVKDCYLYSRQDPNPPTNKYKRNTIADCVKEVEVYIENIIAKFGSFNYSEFKTPFNPQNEQQHLFDMIPGVRINRARRRSTAYKSDLTLRIIKTADNNLSIVKKGTERNSIANQALEHVKKIVDLTEDDLSRTPTPPITLTINSKKRSSDVKHKSNKGAHRNASTTTTITITTPTATTTTTTRPTTEKFQTPIQEKTYQILRRKSMAAEKIEPKKVSAVILKRKSIHTNSISNRELDQQLFQKSVVSLKRSKLPATSNDSDKIKEQNINKETEADTTKAKSNVNRKRKRSNDQTAETPTDKNETPAKLSKEDTNKDSQCISETNKNHTEAVRANNGTQEKVQNEEMDSGILASLGLSRIAQNENKKQTNITLKNKPEETKETEINDGQTDVNASANVEKLFDCDTEIVNSAPTTPTPNDVVELNGNIYLEKTPRIVLVPFIELKEEPKDCAQPETIESIATIANETINQTLSSTTSDNSIDKLKDSTNSLDETSIKIEPISSDDESLSIVEDIGKSGAAAVNTASTRQSGVSKLIENIRRGGITVRDINKMTNSPHNSHKSSSKRGITQRARKTFPQGPDLSLLSSFSNRWRNNPQMGSSGAAMNNMVYIPLDGNRFPRIANNQLGNMGSSKTASKSNQPPPLTVVGANQNITSVTMPMPSATNMMSNGPPPLSMTSSNPSGNSLLVHPNQIQNSSNHNQSSSASSSMPLNNITSGLVTEQLASAVTETILRAPPKLTSRPTAPLRSDGDVLFPSEAGSVCRTLMENAHKMTDFFRSVIEDTLSDMGNTTNPEARIKLLEMELEKLKYSHAKDMMELKGNTDTVLNEMKKSMEKERIRTINETRKQCELERMRAIEETKKKQWCINCGKEAQFYCCWNTSYCDYPCQQQHWVRHMSSCAQVENNSVDSHNPRRSNLKPSGSKLDNRQHQMKPMMPAPKDNTQNVMGHRSVNQLTPSLRNIMSKNSLLQRLVPIGLNNSSRPTVQQSRQMQPVPGAQPCYAIVNHPMNWELLNSKSKPNSGSNHLISSASLLNTNAIIVSTAGITSNASTSVSLPAIAMKTTNSAPVPPLAATNSKSSTVTNETILISSD